jgi:hypothetical protein
MKLIATLLFILGTYYYSNAQINNQLLENRYSLAKPYRQRVLLSVYNVNFLKNNEYFNKITSGYTLFGTQLYTQLAYVPNRFIRVQAGVYMRKDYGNPNITNLAPLFNIKLAKNGFALLFGNYEANLHHRLIEPLYNTELFITRPVESGIQFNVNKKKYWSDTWIDWEVQQYLNSAFKEELTGGHHSSILLYKSDSSLLEIKMPVQALINHKGGQLDTLPQPIITTINSAFGISIEKKFNKKSFLKSIKTENYYCIYSDRSGNVLKPFTIGRGVFLNASAMSKYNVNLSVGYWKGNGFVAEKGGYLYQSDASIYGKTGYIEKNRQLLFMRLLYQKRIFNGVTADVRLEPYYDLNNKELEFSHSIYLTYKKYFILTKVKPLNSK